MSDFLLCLKELVCLISFVPQTLGRVRQCWTPVTAEHIFQCSCGIIFIFKEHKSVQNLSKILGFPSIPISPKSSF